jgi:hypothetical protein
MCGRAMHTFYICWPFDIDVRFSPLTTPPTSIILHHISPALARRAKSPFTIYLNMSFLRLIGRYLAKPPSFFNFILSFIFLLYSSTNSRSS